METRQVRAMKWTLLISSVASFILLATSAYQENFRGEWRRTQEAYRELLIVDAADETALRAATSYEVEHKQLFLEELERIDRCTTCHLGVENPAMAKAEVPFRVHSGDLLRHHPTEEFGCTVCHLGHGREINKRLAHGRGADGEPIAHAESPMLSGRKVYTSCGKCHTEIDLYGGEADLYAQSDSLEAGAVSFVIDERSLRSTLPGADDVARGKKLVVDLGCLGCHKYRGRGGVLGPDITYVGDKTRHDFDFAHVRGAQTVEQWLYEHFRFPAEVSPETLMPNYGLTDTQAHELTAYMMSLHRKTGLASHTPRPWGRSRGAVETVRGETLYAMYCSSCHGANGTGTTTRGGLWPADADPWGHEWDVREIVTERRGDITVMVPSLNHADTLAVASDDYLRHVIAKGRTGTQMIGWETEGGLSADEVTLVVDYIRNWQPGGPDVSKVSTVRGNAKVGAALYRANCVACHGSNGEGGIGNSLNSATFLAVASDGFLADTIVHGRPNTAMPAWREFNGQEVSDLLAFVRQWQPERSDIDTTLALCAASEAEEVSAAIGGILYKANCVTCHGPDGSGDLAPSLNTAEFLTVVSDRYLAETMMQGRPGTGMPSWRHLRSDDVASIIRFIRTWQTAPSRSAEWHETVVPHGDWDAGRVLFVGTCSGCHGSYAEGATGPQLSNPVFLRSASDVMLREWILNGKSGTEMRGFRKGGQGIAELSDGQIEDIVSYLRSLERLSDEELPRVAKSPYGRPEKGAVIYGESCSGCHGSRGEGASGPALSNPNLLRFASDGFLMATMALGRSGTEMRPVKKSPQSILGLSSDEVNDVVAHLRYWEHSPPFAGDDVAGIPHRFVVPWDLARGKSLFDSYCAGCHGVEGKGLWAPELNNEGFLAAATDGFLQATIVRGRHGTAMRAFGAGGQGIVDLTSDDVDDIVAYMRHWSSLAPSPMTIPAERSSGRADQAVAARTRSVTQAEENSHNSKTSPVQPMAMSGWSQKGD